MRRIIYTSHATDSFCEAELFGIVTTSARRNGDDGLSGFLLYSHRQFLQLLEGPADRLANTYRKIEQDQRHRDCLIVFDETTDNPLFSRWSMRRISDPDDKLMLEHLQSEADGRVPCEIVTVIQKFLDDSRKLANRDAPLAINEKRA